MALLLMGRDASQGRLVLDHHNQAAVDWDNRANRYLYRAEGQVGRAVAPSPVAQRRLAASAGQPPQGGTCLQAATRSANLLRVMHAAAFRLVRVGVDLAFS
jgi:hypothetical protein